MFHRPRVEEESKEQQTAAPQHMSPQRPQDPAPVVKYAAREALEMKTRPMKIYAAPAQEAAPATGPVTEQQKPDNQTTKTEEKVEEKMMNSADQNDSQEAQARPFEKSYNTGMQSPAQAQKPRPFAGPYPGSATPTYTPSENYGVSDGRKLVLGAGITMSGEIEACDYLVVEGTVEAALKGASVLEIAESGTFYGTVEIDEATVAGRFEGDLVVNGRLTIRATGSVTGTIAYKELAVEAGATIDGKVSPMTAAAAGKKPAGKDIKTKSVAPRNDNGDEGNELPFAGSAG